MRIAAKLIAVVLVSLFAGAACGQTVLTVLPEGGGGATAFSLADLAAMEQAEIVTANEFIDGQKRFLGPLVMTVLDRAGARNARAVKMTAANDYQVEIDVAELEKYHAIVALTMDGEPFSLRDKGPLWVIYPMSDYKELRDPVYNSRLIWQLERIEYR